MLTFNDVCQGSYVSTVSPSIGPLNFRRSNCLECVAHWEYVDSFSYTVLKFVDVNDFETTLDIPRKSSQIFGSLRYSSKTPRFRIFFLC